MIGGPPGPSVISRSNLMIPRAYSTKQTKVKVRKRKRKETIKMTKECTSAISVTPLKESRDLLGVGLELDVGTICMPGA